MPELSFPIQALNREILTEINLGEALIAFVVVVVVVSAINRYTRSQMLKPKR